MSSTRRNTRRIEEGEDGLRPHERLDAMIASYSGTPREHLIAMLAAYCGDDEAGEPRTRALVDALDEYLAEPDRAAPLVDRINMGPEDAIAERDAALARAEKAEKELGELRLKFAAATATPPDPEREDA